MTTTTPTPVAPAAAAAIATAPPRILGILSLAIGAASLAFGLFFIFPVVAIVLGVLALQREPQNRAISIGGIVTASVSLAGGVIAVIGALAFLPIFGIITSFAGYGWN